MVQATDTDELKTQIKRLNSKAGQMKMDLHDLAEGLPTDYERLIEAATETYEIYHQINQLKQQLKQSEQKS
ncbi:CCE_0567 family metalloprotein [Leptolyngbya ohadii]|uniref:CCE_0567 family metalloprotein n=1 Tax=Leptolyngbya ohadii TaxID=1962290 RepID=UPI000B59E880|nr:CCE_0567 family metalloprotein [Leptolyngbya ohadii]